uniref:Peptidoglycan-recognition protein n=1 Tax=Ostrinia nubilalis TaxID=29057 RepID=E7DN56_OSTNU|nr:peptidoglycan recognition protein A [Ostrinia nubilalis]
MKSLVLAAVIMFAGAGQSLDIVPIKEWGGSELQYKNELETPLRFAIVHHTVTNECSTDEECVSLLNNLRGFYIQSQIGWGDVPYSFMIGGNGKVYEGAGWHNSGAHTFLYNQRSIGIGFLGDFREKTPTPEALQAAQDLLNFGLENNYLWDDYKLLGAQQIVNTISPGDPLQKVIEGWPHWAENPFF